MTAETLTASVHAARLAAAAVVRELHPRPVPGREWVWAVLENAAASLVAGDADAARAAARLVLAARTTHDPATVAAMAAGYVDLAGRYVVANAALAGAVATEVANAGHVSYRHARLVARRLIRQSRHRDN